MKLIGLIKKKQTVVYAKEANIRTNAFIIIISIVKIQQHAALQDIRSHYSTQLADEDFLYHRTQWLQILFYASRYKGLPEKLGHYIYRRNLYSPL